MLGWEPNVGLDEGLQRTIEYFRNMRTGLDDEDLPLPPELSVGMQERALHDTAVLRL
ncbi:hypothetical protein [Noviherbaspirillum saxi]|uniref:hypothetical protein n=1 Tax=Noviherbaspirillum saxi TaxID=2320863 RepID=UPI0018F62213